ncbi:MAG: helix-turn-helix domain-containing protein [Acidimicrobiia bacterium]|nr:helix-turn-helix domain-containing protein [Acidimicrobiia bacterium]
MAKTNVDEKSTNDGSSGLLLTLDRGIQVLEQIAREQGRATAKSLSAELDINLGTCYQLLRTLQAHSYIHRLAGGRYGLGTRIGFLADHYESEVAPSPELMDILHELHDTLRETVYISVRRRHAIPIVGVLEGTQMLRVGNLTVGYSGHNHIRASAKAFLAYADEKTLDEFFDSKTLETRTPNTITTWDAFLDELHATRERGYGIDNEEYAEGVTCLGTVIFDDEGRPYGAYGTSFPARRFPTDEETIAEGIIAAGEKASRLLGYEGAYPPESG